MTPPPPHRVSVRIVEVAATALPAAHRGRYHREFLAELYGLTPSDQLRHATQVLSRAWALRSALAEPALAMKGAATMPIVARRPLICLVLDRHKWQLVSTDDGTSRYRRCRKCGKERPPGEEVWRQIPPAPF
jgi:hypothetical protein